MEELRTYCDACNNISFLNRRIVVWPLFIAAVFMIEQQEKDWIDEGFPKFYPARPNFQQANPRNLIQELWVRNGTSIQTSPGQIAGEWAIELGIW